MSYFLSGNRVIVDACLPICRNYDMLALYRLWDNNAVLKHIYHAALHAANVLGQV